MENKTIGKNKVLATSLQIALLIYSFFVEFFSILFIYYLFVVVLLISVFYVVSKCNRLRLNGSVFALTVLYLGYVVMYIVPEILKTYDPERSHSGMFMAIVMVIGVLMLYITPSYSAVLKAILLFSSIHVFFTVFSFLFPVSFTNYIIPLLPENISEQTLYFLQNNLHAGITAQTGRNSVYISCGLLVLVGNTLPKKQFRSIRLWLILSIFFFAILLTGKRGTLLAVVFSFFVVVTVYSRKNHKKIFRSVLVATIILTILYSTFLILVPGTSAILNRFIRKDGADITSGRNILFSNAFALFLQRPVFGWGFQHYSRLYEMDVHNTYLQLLADAGLVGLLILVFIFAVYFITSVNMIRRTNYTNKERLQRLYISLAFQVFFLIYGLTDEGILNIFVFIIYFILSSFSVHYARTCCGSRKISQRA